MAGEGFRTGIGLKAARVEHVAAVECQSEGLVEEILSHTKVHAVVGLAVSLRDDLPGVVVARHLQRDVVG